MTRQDEAALATFYARPEWRDIRHLVEQLAPGSVEPIEALVRKVRRDQWGDRSQD